MFFLLFFVWSEKLDDDKFTKNKLLLPRKGSLKQTRERERERKIILKKLFENFWKNLIPVTILVS